MCFVRTTCINLLLSGAFSSDPSVMDTLIKQYSIIETQDEEGQTITSVVPTKWIFDDVVLCPQNSKDEDKAVKAYIDVNSETWKVLPCKIRKTYGSYAKAREMLPMAEDTDGLDTDKERGRGMRKKKRNISFDDDNDTEDDDETYHIQMSKQKRKTLPVPPKSTYKKQNQFDIKSSSSVRNALQRLKNQRAEKKNENRINERLQTEKEIDDNIEGTPKKRSAKDINIEFEKARKRIQERIEKARQEREKEICKGEKPATIDKENQMLNDQYDSQLRSDLSSVSPLDDVENDIEKGQSVTTCRPVSTLVARDHPKSSMFNRPSSASSNQSQSSFQSYNMPYLPTSSVLNARQYVPNILSAPLTANESNLNQDKSPSFSANILLALKAVLSKQEEVLRNCRNLDHKLDLVIDLVRSAEDTQKPEGWPTFPLTDMTSFYEWELFLQNSDNYDFAVSHFSVVAGRGTHEGEMATSICKKMFSPEVASNLNWIGTELKKGIKSMKCGACIIDACAKQYKGNFVKSKVTGSISTWLRSNSHRRVINN